MNEAVCQSGLMERWWWKADESCTAPERAPAGKPTGCHTEHRQLLRFQVQVSSDSTSSELSEPHTDTKMYSWPQMIKSCWVYTTSTQKEAWQRILQCLTPKSCLISWSKQSKTHSTEKKFPLRALFLLVTVVVRKSGWNMEPYDHQKMLWSLSIQIKSMSRRTNPALYAAWQRNSSMASSEGTEGILNKMYSL